MTTPSRRPSQPGRRPGGGASGSGGRGGAPRGGHGSRDDRGGQGSGWKSGGGKTYGGKPAGGKPGAKSGGAGRSGGQGGGYGARKADPNRGIGGPNKGFPRKAPAKAPPANIVHTDAHEDVHDPNGVRLQKLLASAGVGSRRACEEFIQTGRVEVDGQIVTELGVRIDPATQVVRVDGERIVVDDTRVYFAFNKPRGVVTTMNDEKGRPSIEDYVGRRKERLFHVGRLDADTEGLLILTNDGDLAHKLQHPQYHVPKTYVALVPGPIPRDLGKQLRDGVMLDDGPVKADSFKMLDAAEGKALVEVVIHEGRKHIVRRMLAEVGHPVLELVRIKVGPIMLGDLAPGKMRPLTQQEIAGLYGSAGM